MDARLVATCEAGAEVLRAEERGGVGKCGFWDAPRAPWRHVAGNLGGGGTLPPTRGCTGVGTK